METLKTVLYVGAPQSTGSRTEGDSTVDGPLLETDLQNLVIV